MISSGVEGLDRLLGGWAGGDNVVWLTERSRVYEAIERAFLEGTAAGRPGIVGAATRGRADQRAADVTIDATAGSALARAVPLADALDAQLREHPGACIVVDGFGTLVRRWGQAEAAAFFARVCPTMLQAGAITYWRMPAAAGDQVAERIRQVAASS